MEGMRKCFSVMPAMRWLVDRDVAVPERRKRKKREGGARTSKAVERRNSEVDGPEVAGRKLHCTQWQERRCSMVGKSYPPHVCAAVIKGRLATKKNEWLAGMEMVLCSSP
ncbi:hypothetical protein SESBI_16317 [Sesbania bispinosa]|nr:hypothetical protein SESBI_16317 [Sesbania bispinosa]